MPRLAAVMVPLTLLLACVHVRQIPPAELAQLDGFDSEGVSLSGADPGHRYVTLKDVDGEAVAFSTDSRLRLLLDDGRTVEERFRLISVRDGALTGTTGGGSSIVVPLQEVRSADVSWLNGGFSALAIIGGAVTTLGVITLIGYLLSMMFRSVPGRPLRLGGKPAVAKVRANTEWVACDVAPNVERLSPRARAVLAGAWLADAQAEHASVAAFSRLSSMLLAAGAPPGLVAAAHRAALEEVDHAQRTFALASAYAGRPLGPAPLPQLLAAPAFSADVVSQLAVESLLDGCMNEGLAAGLAAAASRVASDAAVRASLEVIARDEAAHGELAWDIASWCLRTSDRARDAFAASLERLPQKAHFDGLAADLAAELSSHGRLEASLQREVFARVRADVLARAQQLLSDSARAQVA